MFRPIRGRFLAVLSVGLLAAGTLLVGGATSASAGPQPTFDATPTTTYAGGSVDVFSNDDCLAPVGATGWTVIINVAQGANPQVSYTDFSPTDVGAWHGTVPMPADLVPGPAQLTATCFDSHESSIPEVEYAPVDLSINPFPPSAPVFTADTPPVTTGVAGHPFPSYTFVASGYPAPAYSIFSGSIPNGMSLDATTGALSGTPNFTGQSTFVVNAENHVSPDAQTPTITITVVAPAAPAFTADTPPSTAMVAAAFPSYTFVASGAPAPSYSVSSGALPDGLTVDPATGVLSGQPSTTGDFHFAITATNGVSPDAVTPTITISVATLPPVVISTTGLPDAIVGMPYAATLAATGGDGGPYAWSLASGSALPDGLTLSPSGDISGTPTAAGTTSFTVSVDDPVTSTLTLVVDAAIPTPGSASTSAGGDTPAGNTPAADALAADTSDPDALAFTGAAHTVLFTGSGLALIVLGGLSLLATRGRRRPAHRPE